MNKCCEICKVERVSMTMLQSCSNPQCECHKEVSKPDWDKRYAMGLVNELYELAQLTVNQRKSLNDQADEIVIRRLKELFTSHEAKYLDWMREFSLAMSLEGIVLPTELSDVQTVVEAIKNKIDSARKERDVYWLNEMQLAIENDVKHAKKSEREAILEILKRMRNVNEMLENEGTDYTEGWHRALDSLANKIKEQK